MIHFCPLSDRFTVDAPLYGKNIYSLGDFVLFGGGALVVVQALASLVPRRGGAAISRDPSASQVDKRTGE